MLFLRKYYKLHLELSSSLFLDFARCMWVGWCLVRDIAGHYLSYLERSSSPGEQWEYLTEKKMRRMTCFKLPT